jgi:imidazolonepropionase-like amidohydrolase
MKQTWTSAIFAAFFLCVAGFPQAKPVVAITHVNVIDMTGASPKPDMTVLITKSVITRIGKSKSVSIPKGATVVDGTNKWLIPGLWDMHVHWFSPQYFGLFTANGVTGVREMLGDPHLFEIRKAIEDRELVGPRMVIDSPLVDGPGGGPDKGAEYVVHNAEEGRTAVRELKAAGYDAIKVYQSLPRDAYFAIADESKREGIPFEGHVPTSVRVIEASDAGQKSIEHFTMIIEALSTREDEMRTGKASRGLWAETYSPEKAQELFSHLAKNHTWVCPTLTAGSGIYQGNMRESPRNRYLPPFILSRWFPPNDPTAGTNVGDSDRQSRFNKQWQAQIELVGNMVRAGIGILVGTDASVAYSVPGFSLHDELVLYAQSGITPMQALQTATINPARFLGKDKELGTVEEGKHADLVLLNANPLDDMHNLDKIAAVFQDGRMYSRQELDSILEHIAELSKRGEDTVNYVPGWHKTSASSLPPDADGKLSGKWDGTLKLASGEEGALSAQVQQAGSTLSGTITFNGMQSTIEDGKLQGDEVTWTVPVGGGLKFRLTLQGDALDGRAEGQYGGAAHLVKAK